MTHDGQDLERLELVLGGPVFFQALRSAVELNLFTFLDDNPGASLLRLADLAAVEQKPMRILLLACTALGLIERKGDAYYNSAIAGQMLNQNSSQNIIPAIQFTHHLVYRAMFHMHEAIQKNCNVGLSEFPGDGATLYERLSHSPELERVFQNGLQATSRLNVEQLISHFDFSRVHHVIDIAGGNGTALCVLAEKHHHLKGTVFETPTVATLACENIAAAGLSDRITTCAGNTFTDPFPTGADCVLLMHFLTIWSEESNIALLRKSYDALPPGGHVVVFDGAQSNDQTGPLRAARWSPYFLVLSSGQGMFYRPDEYASWMKTAGLVDVRQLVTSPDHVVVTGRKPAP